MFGCTKLLKPHLDGPTINFSSDKFLCSGLPPKPQQYFRYFKVSGSDLRFKTGWIFSCTRAIKREILLVAPLDRCRS